MKKFCSYVFILNILVCSLALVVVLFTISILKWKPCPMCLLQQFCVLMILFFSLFAWLFKKHQKASFLMQIIIIITVLIGVYIAADQSYIQYFMTESSDNGIGCGAITNKFLIDATKSLTGTVQSCSDTSETISGLSLAVYSFIFFLSLLIVNTLGLLVRIFKKD